MGKKCSFVSDVRCYPTYFWQICRRFDQLTAINHLHTSRFFGKILDEYDDVETTLKYLAEEQIKMSLRAPWNP